MQKFHHFKIPDEYESSWKEMAKKNHEYRLKFLIFFFSKKTEIFMQLKQL
jgi:hypothetical protein